MRGIRGIHGEDGLNGGSGSLQGLASLDHCTYMHPLRLWVREGTALRRVEEEGLGG